MVALWLKKSLKDAFAHTEAGRSARPMRQTGKVFQDFSHHEAYREHEDAASACGIGMFVWQERGKNLPPAVLETRSHREE